MAFTVGYLALLSAAPLQAGRYLLPVLVLACYMAGRGLAWLIARAPWGAPAQVAVAALCLIPILGWEGVKCERELRLFANSRVPDLVGWIQTHLPPGSRIVQDNPISLPPRILLAGGGDRFVTVESSGVYAPDLVHSIEEARRRGFTHAAVSERSYAGFFSWQVVPVRDRSELYKQRKLFYEQLFRDGELLWQYRSPDESLVPEVRLYRLSTPSK